jgi:DNA-binding MarR family transcriptional regulator
LLDVEQLLADDGSVTVDDIDVTRLRLAVNRLHRRLRLSSAGGLTPSQLSCLATVVGHGPLRLKDLATREAVNPTTLSRIAARLEHDGLVVRHADETDGRGSVLEASAAGHAVLERVNEARTALLAECLATLDTEQQQAIAGALPALEALVATLPVAPGGGTRR